MFILREANSSNVVISAMIKREFMFCVPFQDDDGRRES
jgi:hypothetical protein